MQIQINTDDNIESSAPFERDLGATVESTLGHLTEHITRVEIHLSDENSQKGGSADKRCLIEARMEGYQPVAVTDESDDLGRAVEGAARKLKTALERIRGKLQDR